MRIIHISDWHADAESFKLMFDREMLPYADNDPDIFVLSGDMVVNTGFFRSQPAMEGVHQKILFDQMVEHIERCYPGVEVVGVRGNHDYFDYSVPGDNRDVTSIMINGHRWAFVRGIPRHTGFWNDEYPEDWLAAAAALIPDDTEVLVTHAPPDRILDNVRDTFADVDGKEIIVPRNIGSISFRERVDRLANLKVHMFGHVHEQGGRVEVRNGVVYSNASCTANLLVIPGI